MKANINAKQLRRAGRDIKVPFEISLKNNSVHLYCYEILRILPGKRVIVLARMEDRIVVAKIFFRKWFAKRDVEKESRHNALLSKAGVSVPRIFFMDEGDQSASELQVLVFERLMPSADVVNVLQGNEGPREQSQLLNKVVAMLAKLHQSGICPKDLHAKNFIQTKNKLFMIDAADIQFRAKALTLMQGIKNLALWVAQLAPKHDALSKQLLDVYLQEWPSQEVTEETLTYLNKVRQHYRAERERRKFKKIFRHSTHFVAHKSFTRCWACNRGYYSEELLSFFKDPDTFMKRGEIIKPGNTCTVAKLNMGQYELIVKRFNIKSFLHGLKRAITKSRAAKCWENAHRLLDYQILTPQPIAFLEQRIGPFRRKAYYLSAYVEGELLNDFYQRNKQNKKSFQPVYEELSKMIALLEHVGLAHGDMKATNFILSHFDVYLLDLDSMKRYRTRKGLEKAVSVDRKRFEANW